MSFFQCNLFVELLFFFCKFKLSQLQEQRTENRNIVRWGSASQRVQWEHWNEKTDGLAEISVMVDINFRQGIANCRDFVPGKTIVCRVYNNGRSCMKNELSVSGRKAWYAG